jgi:hypothetical protein
LLNHKKEIKMPYIYSTITASNAYTIYGQAPEGGLPSAQTICEIKGGAGVSDKNFITPRGVATFVTDAQLEALNQCPAYLRHKAAGYLVEDRSEMNPEMVAHSMKEGDGSAPIKPSDFPEDQAPVTNIKKAKRRG